MRSIMLALVGVLCVGAMPAAARAGGTRWGISLGFGISDHRTWGSTRISIYSGPRFGGYGVGFGPRLYHHPIYRPAPVIVAPRVVYAPSPVIYAAPPVVYTPTVYTAPPVIYAPAPVVCAPPVVYRPAPVCAAPPVIYAPSPYIGYRITFHYGR